MTRPRLLDLFCCQGGAGMGYHRAGFEVVGVDINPQPRYPFEFHQADALEYVAEHGHEFDAIHASPPCQAHTTLGAVWRAVGGDYDNRHADLIPQTRAAMIATGKPWVIENVEGAPLINPGMLCGRMFGLRLFRHRLFETSFLMLFPHHAPHDMRAPRTSRQPGPGEVYSFYGHFSGARQVAGHIECEWMTQDGLSQAIPPAYTEYIGRQLIAAIIERREGQR